MSDAHAYPHEPTGVETRKLGFWVFLSTEILFFGTLITTFLIFKGRDFPGIKLTDVYDIPFTSVSSFVLLMSSLTMVLAHNALCLLYTSPSPRDGHQSRMPSSA